MKQLIIIQLAIFFSAITVAQTLSLDSCHNLALRHNITAQNAKLEVDIAKQVKLQALSKYFPKIQLVGGAFHSQNPIIEFGISDINSAATRQYLQTIYAEYGTILGLQNSLQLLERGIFASAVAFQPIFAGGQIVNGNRLAKLGIEIAKAKQVLENLKLTQQVDEAFWLIISLQEKQKTILQACELLDTIYGNVKLAVESGLATKTDLLKVKLKQNELKLSTAKIENGLDLARLALCQLCGINYSDSLKLYDYQYDTIESPLKYFVTPEEAVPQRAERQLLDMQVRAEELKCKMLVGATLPQVGLGASYSFNNVLFDKNSLNGTLFATIKVPITDWWETGHKLREQHLRQQIAENSRTDFSEKMALQTQRAWNELQQSYQQLQFSDEAVETSRLLLDIAQENYTAGMITLSELLETQTAHQQAIDLRCDHTIAYRIQLARYQQITK